MGNQGLKNLGDRHKQIARMLVGGNSQSEIARLLDIHKSTVSRLVRDPLVGQIGQRQHDFGLRPEIEINRALADLRALGDIVDSRLAVTVVANQSPRGLEDEVSFVVLDVRLGCP